MSNSPTNNEDKLLDALLALRERLCLSGFDPGLQRTLAAQQLLLRLAAEGRLPLARSEWRDWLAPVFCDSKEHQAEFVQQFQAWVREFPGTGDTTNELSQETSTTTPAPSGPTTNPGEGPHALLQADTFEQELVPAPGCSRFFARRLRSGSS